MEGVDIALVSRDERQQLNLSALVSACCIRYSTCPVDGVLVSDHQVVWCISAELLLPRQDERTWGGAADLCLCPAGLPQLGWAPEGVPVEDPTAAGGFVPWQQQGCHRG